MIDTILRIYLELGDTAVQSGQGALATTLFNTAIKVVRDQDGQEARLASVLTAIAKSYAKYNHYEKAESHYRWALLVYLNVIGPNTVQVRSVLENLAELSLAQGKRQRAAQYYRRVLAYERKPNRKTIPIVADRLQRASAVVAAQEVPGYGDQNSPVTAH